MGNGYTTFLLSPTHGEGIYWGVGPVLFYPTATNQVLGVNKWGSGVSVALLKKDAGPWEFGVVANNIWSAGGPPHGTDRYNQMMLNPFVGFHFGDGWAVGSSPNVTADWVSKSGQQWTVPVGVGISKVLRIGGQPIRFGLDTYYNAIRPTASSETWLLQATVTLVFAP